MIQKIKLTLLSLAALFLFSSPVLVAGSVSAATASQEQINNCLKQGATFDFSDNSCSKAPTADKSGTLNEFVRNALNILSIIVGVVAVVMIIIGGFRYVVSGGKQESVAAAKNTILYGIIGLIVVALAQVIVQFILVRTT